MGVVLGFPTTSLPLVLLSSKAQFNLSNMHATSAFQMVDKGCLQDQCRALTEEKKLSLFDNFQLLLRITLFQRKYKRLMSWKKISQSGKNYFNNNEACWSILLFWWSHADYFLQVVLSVGDQFSEFEVIRQLLEQRQFFSNHQIDLEGPHD